MGSLVCPLLGGHCVSIVVDDTNKSFPLITSFGRILGVPRTSNLLEEERADPKNQMKATRTHISHIARDLLHRSNFCGSR